VRRYFKNSELGFDIKTEYVKVTRAGLKSKAALDNCLDYHQKIIIANSEEFSDAELRIKLLDKEIEFQVRQYSYCISKSTENYQKWLKEEYMRKLLVKVRQFYF
jgi:hypothetical protein